MKNWSVLTFLLLLHKIAKSVRNLVWTIFLNEKHQHPKNSKIKELHILL